MRFSFSMFFPLVASLAAQFSSFGISVALLPVWQSACADWMADGKVPRQAA
jgi:hypothetical protein